MDPTDSAGPPDDLDGSVSSVGSERSTSSSEKSSHRPVTAVVLDVGVSRIVDPATGRGRIAGDVADGVDEVAAWMSPNPGGVGPMTRALLLANVVETAERRAGIG